MKVTVKMNPTSQIVKRIGLDESGQVQRFWTSTVLRRIVRYMPYQTGMTIKVTVAQTDINKPLIVTDTPYAKFLYHGKLMVSDVTGSPWARKGETKHVVNTPLSYSKAKNPQAGPYWDRRLTAAEGKVMAKELQNYIDRRGGR